MTTDSWGNTPDPTNVRNSSVVVTGAGSGLGRQIALRFAELGRSVAIWDVNEAGADDTARMVTELGVNAIALKVDVGDPVAVEAATAATIDKIGDIGTLIAAAGFLRQNTIGDIPDADWDLAFHVNLDGLRRPLEALLPSLRRVGRGANVVAIASTEALRGNPTIAAYTASKHAVLGLVRHSALALGGDGIRVNAICPGAMDTPMLRKGLEDAPPGSRAAMEASIPLGYVSDPVEVSEVAKFLGSPESSYITGAAIVVDGGMNA